MSLILAELSNWAKDLPYWEQSALDQIVSGLSFSEADFERLIQFALEDKELAERKSPRPSLKLNHLSSEGRGGVSNSLRLHSISNLQNINALAFGQTLPFGQALTVIYGANGAGKSGYARVLGCAGFTRGDREILRDINQPSESDEPQTAQIKVETADGIKDIPFKIGQDCPELNPFYAFDSTSITVHLTKSNKISFTPAGLSYLTRLSKILDDCNERLKQKLAPARQPHNFTPLFQGNSEVARLIANLGPQTKEKELNSLATLSGGEQEQFEQLERKIAQLKSQNTTAQIAELRRQGGDLSQLTQKLQESAAALNEAAIRGFNAAITAVIEQQHVAEVLGSKQFAVPFFSQTGNPVWRHFLEAAQKLAVTEKDDYPSAEDHCLLCHQPLSLEAQERLHKFWAFLQDESQSRLKALRNELDQKHRALVAATIVPFDENQIAYRLLQQHDPALANLVTTFVSEARDYHQTCCQALQSASLIQPISLPSVGIVAIEQIISALLAQAAELEQTKAENSSNEIAVLEQQWLELKHRQVLHQHLEELLAWLGKRKWAEKASKALSNTQHISRKYDELFKRLVTDEYIRVFESVLNDLHCPLKVRLKTKTVKGETLKTVMLETETSPDKPAARTEKIEKVLSEGEKRAVALADFLTEVSQDENSCGIVLDDPVTSLDWEWKEVVARRLVNEGRQRQVIIFTHDLHFLYLIKKHAQENTVDLSAHLIAREGENGRPGFIYPNNSPATEGEQRNPQLPLECWQKSKQLVQPGDRELQLHAGFSYLRRSYEALVVHDIFGSVVKRFEERVSIGRLKDVVADQEILTQVMQKYDVLSGFIGGHLASDEATARSLTPEMLKREIDDYEALRAKIKELRKAKGQ